MPDLILSLAAQVVSAHLAKNAVSREDLPQLIKDVHRAFANAGQATVEPPRGEPAIAIKKSVTPGHIVCLECGKHFSMLKRHLHTDHQLTPEQYRQKWSLPQSYPIVAPDYSKTRSALAKEVGLGRKGLRKASRKAQR